MNFAEAMVAAGEGFRVTRAGWNGKDMYVAMWQVSTLTLMEIRSYAIRQDAVDRDMRGIRIKPFMMMKTVDGDFCPWLASQLDIFADDWSVIY